MNPIKYSIKNQIIPNNHNHKKSIKSQISDLHPQQRDFYKFLQKPNPQLRPPNSQSVTKHTLCYKKSPNKTSQIPWLKSTIAISSNFIREKDVLNILKQFKKFCFLNSIEFYHRSSPNNTNSQQKFPKKIITRVEFNIDLRSKSADLFIFKILKAFPSSQELKFNIQPFKARQKSSLNTQHLLQRMKQLKFLEFVLQDMKNERMESIFEKGLKHLKSIKNEVMRHRYISREIDLPFKSQKNLESLQLVITNSGHQQNFSPFISYQLTQKLQNYSNLQFLELEMLTFSHHDSRFLYFFESSCSQMLKLKHLKLHVMSYFVGDAEIIEFAANLRLLYHIDNYLDLRFKLLQEISDESLLPLIELMGSQLINTKKIDLEISAKCNYSSQVSEAISRIELLKKNDWKIILPQSSSSNSSCGIF